jgi:hypothetical protein
MAERVKPRGSFVSQSDKMFSGGHSAEKIIGDYI